MVDNAQTSSPNEESKSTQNQARSADLPMHIDKVELQAMITHKVEAKELNDSNLAIAYQFISFLGLMKLVGTEKDSSSTEETNIFTSTATGTADNTDANSTAPAPNSDAAADVDLAKLPLGVIGFTNIDEFYIVKILELVLQCRVYSEQANLLLNTEEKENFNQVEFKLPRTDALDAQLKESPQIQLFGNAVDSCLCESNFDAAYWRNNQIDGKKVISTITGATDTTSHLSRITSDSLKDLAPNLVNRFIAVLNKRHQVQGQAKSLIEQEINLTPLQERQLQKLLTVLVHSSYLSCTLLELASYIGAVLNHLAKFPQQTLQEALGAALPYLHLPCDSMRFINLVKNERQSDYNRILSSYHKLCSGLPHRYGVDNQVLDTKELKENLEQMLAEAQAVSQAETQGNDFNTSTEHLLQPWESALLKDYLNHFADDAQYGEKYEQISFIEWTGKLERFFAIKQGKRKEPLSVQTKNLFISVAEKRQQQEQEQQDNPDAGSAYHEIKIEDVLTDPADIDTINAIDTSRSKLTPADYNSFYKFFQQQRSVFDQDAKISKQWQRIIFSEQLKGEDFLLNLSKVMLSLVSRQKDSAMQGHYDGDEDNGCLHHITFKLDMSTAEINKLNYHVISFFCCRYGPLLRELALLQHKDIQDGSNGISGRNADNADIAEAISSATAQASLFRLEVSDGTEMRHPLLHSLFCASSGNADTDDAAAQSFDDLMKDKRKAKPEPTADALSHNATLKFAVTPFYGPDQSGTPIKFEWSLKQSAVGVMLERDLANVRDSKCLQIGCFMYNAFSTQGENQALNLNDINTLSSCVQGEGNAYGLFFATKSHLQPQNNVSELFSLTLQKLQSTVQSYISSDNLQIILSSINDIDASFKSFSQSYLELIASMSFGCFTLVEVKQTLELYNQLYVKLLQLLMHDTLQELGTPYIHTLLRLVMSIGLAYIPHKDSFNQVLTTNLEKATKTANIRASANDSFNQQAFYYAIATPLHMESIRSYANKLERVRVLLFNVFASDLYIGDQKLIERSFSADFNYNDNPELVLSSKNEVFHGTNSQYQDVILMAKQNRAGYTLYETEDLINASYEEIGFNNNKAKTRGRASTKDKITANTSDLKVPISTYVDAFSDQLGRYLRNNAYLMDNCTIMIYHTGIISIPMAIYRALLTNVRFARTKFNLLIVSKDIESAKDIFKSFEYECFKAQADNSVADFVRRVTVKVLVEDISGSRYGLSYYINGGDVSPFVNSNSKRIADLCLIFHAFDTNADYHFSSNHRVVVVKDEVKYNPETFDFANNNDKESSRFIACPFQPLSKVFYLLALDSLVLGVGNQSMKEQTQSMKEHTMSFLQDYASTKSQGQLGNTEANKILSAQIPLYERSISFNNSNEFSNWIVNAHNYAEEVLYFDDLIAKQHLKKQEIQVIYYQKLANSNLNFMIAKKKADYHTENLTEELQKMGFLDQETNQEISDKVLNDAIDLSGSVIMRADSRKINTSEMIGLVLSRFVAGTACQHLISTINASDNKTHQPSHRPVELIAKRFLMLDDYAVYFNSKQDKLRADILCMQILKYRDDQNTNADCSTNEYLMTLMVVESKFLSAYQDKAATDSLKQTVSTVKNIYNVLSRGESSTTLDRRPYLNLLANMLSENVDQDLTLTHQYMNELTTVQELIRDERIDILLQGCSFVFSHENTEQTVFGMPKFVDSNIATTSQLDRDHLSVLQICFHREAVSRILRDYNLEANSNYDLLANLFSEIISHDNKGLIESYFTFNEANVRHLSPTKLQTPTAAQRINSSRSAPQNYVKVGIEPETETEAEAVAEINVEPHSDGDVASDSARTTNTSSVEGDESHSPSCTSKPTELVDQVQSDSAKTVETVEPVEPVEITGSVKDQDIRDIKPDDLTSSKDEIEPETSESDKLVTNDFNPELAKVWQEHPLVHKLFLESHDSEFEIETPERVQRLNELEQKLIAHYSGKMHINPNEIHVYNKSVAANTYIFEINSTLQFNFKRVQLCSSHMLSAIGYHANVSELPNRISIALSIPREEGLERRIAVPYFYLLKQHKFNYGDADKPFFNSKFIIAQSANTNDIIYFDQRKYDSHTIVAGTTGSGKTVFLQNLIIDMTLTNSPQELELIIIDGKGAGDFSNFVDLPHLRGNRIINDENCACDLLKALVEEMDQRQHKFEQGFPDSEIKHKFSKIDEYNKAALMLGKEPLSRVFLIWDEFTSFMADRNMRNKMLPMLTKLATKARSAGIYMILTAQRPDAKIFDGQIKSNCNNRICFCVKDQQNTRIVMGEGCTLSAKNLGPGEMIYSFSDNFKLAQAPFNTNEMILALTQAIQNDYEHKMAAIGQNQTVTKES